MTYNIPNAGVYPILIQPKINFTYYIEYQMVNKTPMTNGEMVSCANVSALKLPYGLIYFQLTFTRNVGRYVE